MTAQQPRTTVQSLDAGGGGCELLPWWKLASHQDKEQQQQQQQQRTETASLSDDDDASEEPFEDENGHPVVMLNDENSTTQQQQEEKTTERQAFLHLLKGYVGPGCLSLPWAISQLGSIPLGCAAIALVAIWTSGNGWTVVALQRRYHEEQQPLHQHIVVVLWTFQPKREKRTDI